MSDEIEKELAALQAELAQIGDEHETARRAQLLVDTRALVAAVRAHGKGNVAVVDVVSWAPGIPTLAIVKYDAYGIKQYKDQVKSREDNAHPDHAKAAETLSDFAIVYPAKGEGYEKLCEARLGMRVALGVAASNLAAGKAKVEGKG